MVGGDGPPETDPLSRASNIARRSAYLGRARLANPVALRAACTGDTSAGVIRVDPLKTRKNYGRPTSQDARASTPSWMPHRVLLSHVHRGISRVGGLVGRLELVGRLLLCLWTERRRRLRCLQISAENCGRRRTPPSATSTPASRRQHWSDVEDVVRGSHARD